VAVGLGVRVGVGVSVGVAVAVGVGTGVAVAAGVAVGVDVGAAVAVAVAVAVGAGELVAVGVGSRVGVAVGSPPQAAKVSSSANVARITVNFTILYTPKSGFPISNYGRPENAPSLATVIVMPLPNAVNQPITPKVLRWR